MPTPTVHITEFARERIEQVRANRRQPDAGVRIAITGRQEGAFTYDLQLSTAGDVREDELVVEGPEGVSFHLPKASAGVGSAVMQAVQKAGAPLSAAVSWNLSFPEVSRNPLAGTIILDVKGPPLVRAQSVQ